MKICPLFLIKWLNCYAEDRDLGLVYSSLETWKRSLVSVIYRRTVHTNRTENGTFPKPSSNRRNVKTLFMRFTVDGERFETEVFENDDVLIILWLALKSALKLFCR